MNTDTPVITTPLSGGARPWSCKLSPWTPWGQLVDWTADAALDENKAHNCVPESVAMCLKYLREVELPADYIKDVEYSESYVGDTTFARGAWFLGKYCDVKAQEWTATSPSDTLWHVWDALHRGWPVIGLFHYGGTSDGYPHAMPYVYLDSHTIKVSDPWTAGILTWDYATHAAWTMDAGLTLMATRGTL